MDVEKLKWYSTKKNGLRIEKENINLAKEYIQSAEETLSILINIRGKSNMWLATTKYYCEYFSVYALLQRIGITTEIHDCTIELSKMLEEMNIISKGYARQLESDKELRIDNQYYLKNRTVDIDVSSLREYILSIKTKINSITHKEVEDIRKKLKGEVIV